MRGHHGETFFDDFYQESMDSWLRNYKFWEEKEIFWEVVTKIHCRIKGQDRYSLGDDDVRDCLNDLGWGNTNSIEIKKTLEKRGVWDNIEDKELYWRVKELSARFDRLRLVIDVFDPDIVVVFNKKEYSYLDGVYSVHKEEEKTNYHNGVLSRIHTDGLKAKVLWTHHPRKLRIMGLTDDDIINGILEVGVYS